jgi:protein-disulfide isomerase
MVFEPVANFRHFGFKRYPMKLLSALLLSATLASVPAFAADFNEAQKSDIEAIVKNYLLDHPELLQEMSDKLKAKQAQAETIARTKGLSENAEAIFKSKLDPVVGNPKGNVIIVEFMDYNCGWCKRSVGELSQLLETDKDVKVLFKEFPIFGPDSEYAAKAALAANRQGKYWELHKALFSNEGHINAAVVDDVATRLGLDVARMKKDMEDPEITQQIDTNHGLGKLLELSGTPAFIIDQSVSPGYIALDEMKATVAEVRATGCKYC